MSLEKSNPPIDPLIENLRKSLQEQIVLLDMLTEKQAIVRQALLDKNTQGLEKILLDLEKTSVEFETVEHQRENHWQSLKEHLKLGEGPLYSLLVQLPLEAQKSLAPLVRKLRMSVLRLRGFSLTLESYTETSLDMASMAFESFRNALDETYSSHGHKNELSSQALLINEEL